VPVRRRRVLVAVEPAILGDALAGVLGSEGDDVDVIDLRDASADGPAGHYDAAIVTVVLPHGIDADVVIELPDHLGNPGTGSVRHGRITARVHLDGIDDLLDVLRATAEASSPSASPTAPPA
jgi:hypothetical protein